VSTKPARAFSVGLVATAGLLIIVLGIFLVGREQRFWEGRLEYRLQFARTNGLQEGAPVALDGVNVGFVDRMRFPEDPTAQYVEVHVSVSEDVAARIRSDTAARIQTYGLLGDKYIEMNSGTLANQVVEPGGLIRAINPIDYERILGQSGDVVSNVIEVTALLRETLTSINSGEGLLGRLVSDEELGRGFATDMRATVANIESAAMRVDELLERAQSGQGALGALLVEDGEVAEIIDNLEVASRNAADFSEHLAHGDGVIQRLVRDDDLARTTVENLTRASSSIAEITDRVRSGEGTLGKLVYDAALYDKATDLVSPGGPGGFWRLIGNTLAFFLPFPVNKSSEAVSLESPP
jgi:phospholipid/cholesterol/gamma-HCH transport system substrate-binding protein